LKDIPRRSLRAFRARVTRHTVSIRFFGGGILMATLPPRCVPRGGVRVQASTKSTTREATVSPPAASARDPARSRRARRRARSGRESPTPRPDPNERELGARLPRHLSRHAPGRVTNPRSCSRSPQVPSFGRRCESHFRVSSRLTQQPDPPVQTRAPWTAREGTRRPHDGRRERCAPWARPVPRERHPHRAPMPRPSTAAVPIRRGVRFQRRIPFRFRVSAANALTSSPRVTGRAPAHSAPPQKTSRSPRTSP